MAFLGRGFFVWPRETWSWAFLLIWGEAAFGVVFDVVFGVVFDAALGLGFTMGRWGLWGPEP